MKKLLIPITARPHLARQQLLIKELQNHFEIDVWCPKERKGDMAVSAIFYAIEFNNYIAGKDYDAIVIRGDRFEMLGLTMAAVYKGFKVIHIEGGDISGAIDGKVRHAITQLADFHFVTNEESHKRLISMGISPSKVWDFGSLDVEFTSKVSIGKSVGKPYILVAYHPIENEDEKELDRALGYFKKYAIIRTRSNKDYGREYGSEQFAPEEYINLMRGAEICIGNSSSLLKEASILQVPVVLIGDRQKNRLMPCNVIKVPCETDKIKLAIGFQVLNSYPKDLIYYKPNTSKKICQQLRKALK